MTDSDNPAADTSDTGDTADPADIEDSAAKFKHRAATLRTQLTETRARLDTLNARLTRLEGGHVPDEPASADSNYTRHGAALILALSRLGPRERTELVDATAAAAEQLVEALAASADPSSETAAELLKRFTTLNADIIQAVLDEPGAAAIGMLSLLRGFYTEQVVIEALTAGLLPAPPGVEAVALADTTNQAGYDIVFDTVDGEVVAQVKASATGAGIAEHLARYPDIDVVYASSDAAAAIAGRPGVSVIGAGVDEWPVGAETVIVDIGTSSTDLGHATRTAFGTADSGDIFDIDLIDELPLLALTLTLARAARDYVTTEDPTVDISQRLVKQGGSVLMNTGVGTLVGALTGVELLKPVATLGTATGRIVVRQRRIRIDTSVRHLEGVASRLTMIADRLPTAAT